MATSEDVVSGDGNRELQEGGIPGPSEHSIPPRAETPPEPSSNVPFPRDPDYIPRPDVTRQLDTVLAAPFGPAALLGFGGVGKSQIAIEYCYDLRARSPATWVFWINASNAATYEQGVRDALELARVPGRENAKDIFGLLRGRLFEKRKGPWLIVLDKADDVRFLVVRPKNTDSLFKRIPVCNHGQILITSRSRAAASRFVEWERMILVPPMQENDAMMLLEKRLGQQEANTALAEALEYIPLAITQAATYIEQQGAHDSTARYLEELRNSYTSEKSVLEEDFDDPRRYTDSRNSILRTWQISFEQIRSLRPSAADLLSLMSFCDPEVIPDILVRNHRATDDGLSQDLETSEETSSADGSKSSLDYEFDRDITMLEAFVFVSKMPLGDGTRFVFEMHRLVQLATRRWLRAQNQEGNGIGIFIRNLNDVFPSGDFKSWDTCQMLLPHIKAAMMLHTTDQKTLLHRASACFKAGNFAFQKGYFKECEKFCEYAKDCQTSLLGPEHPDTLMTLHRLAAAYWGQERFQEAEKLEVVVLEARKRVLGAEHLDTLRTMGNLASARKKQGRLDEAEGLEAAVLEDLKRLFGPEHPTTMLTMNNLSETYLQRGRVAEAVDLLETVLEKRERVLGLKHYHTVKSVKSLAKAYWGQERWEEADVLQVRALKGHEELYGVEDSRTIDMQARLDAIRRREAAPPAALPVATSAAALPIATSVN